jgi:hypothetical protein
LRGITFGVDPDVYPLHQEEAFIRAGADDALAGMASILLWI